MRTESTWAAVIAGSIVLGLGMGVDTVRAMDPLPVVIPATPAAPYEIEHTAPADLFAYPVAVALPRYELPAQYRDPPIVRAAEWRETPAVEWREPAAAAPLREPEVMVMASGDVETDPYEEDQVTTEAF